jgi:hypothetical protein
MLEEKMRDIIPSALLEIRCCTCAPFVLYYKRQILHAQIQINMRTPTPNHFQAEKHP